MLGLTLALVALDRAPRGPLAWLKIAEVDRKVLIEFFDLASAEDLLLAIDLDHTKPVVGHIPGENFARSVLAWG